MSQASQHLNTEHRDHAAVVLPIRDGKRLADLDDLAAVAERRDDPVIQHQQFLAELAREGIL